MTNLQRYGERLITMNLLNIWRELDLSAEYKYVSMSADKYQEIAFFIHSLPQVTSIVYKTVLSIDRF